MSRRLSACVALRRASRVERRRSVARLEEMSGLSRVNEGAATSPAGRAYSVTNGGRHFCGAGTDAGQRTAAGWRSMRPRFPCGGRAVRMQCGTACLCLYAASASGAAALAVASACFSLSCFSRSFRSSMTASHISRSFTYPLANVAYPGGAPLGWHHSLP